mgnify:CR=1 FL=1
MTFVCLFHAAEASSYTTGHCILQRDLAFNVVCLGIFCHSHHHRLGTAGVNHVKLVVGQYAVHGYITFFAHTSVFCCGVNLSESSKLV